MLRAERPLDSDNGAPFLVAKLKALLDSHDHDLVFTGARGVVDALEHRWTASQPEQDERRAA